MFCKYNIFKNFLREDEREIKNKSLVKSKEAQKKFKIMVYLR